MTKGHVLLAHFLADRDLTAADFARLMQKKARRLRGVRATKRPPTEAVTRYLNGDWAPQYVTRFLIESVTEKAVPMEAWTEPGEGCES